jgi:hypothetical protein
MIEMNPSDVKMFGVGAVNRAGDVNVVVVLEDVNIVVGDGALGPSFFWQQHAQ